MRHSFLDTRSIGLLFLTALLALAGPQGALATAITFDPWDWVIEIDPIDPATGNATGQPVATPLWGSAIVDFDDSNVPGGLGTQTNPEPLPTGGPFEIPIEIVALSLTSMSPVALPGTSETGTITLELNQTTQDAQLPGPDGRVLVENDGGFLSGDSFFDVFVDITLDDGTNPPMVLSNEVALRLGMSFDPSMQIPAADVFWLPSWIWMLNVPGSNLPPPLLFAAGISNPWDVVVDVHGHITPEPGTVALAGLGLLGLAGATRRRRR